MKWDEIRKRKREKLEMPFQVWGILLKLKLKDRKGFLKLKD